MDSTESSMSSIANEATQLLKDILNVGKPPRTSSGSASDVSLHNLPAIDSPHVQSSSETVEENGHSVLQDFLQNMAHQSITTQQITLQGDDMTNSFSVYGRKVDIIASKAGSSTQPNPGSNKVKINPVVNYDWEHKYYIGNLVAVHRSGIYIVYVLKGKSGGIIRIINRKTAERALLKGFSGKVIDVSFAHLSSVVLGVVDEIGNMFIYDIVEADDGKIATNLTLQIDRPEKTPPSENHRIIWCPYMPDEDDMTGTTYDSTVSDDVGKLLVLTHDEIAEMWNVDTVVKQYGSGPLKPAEVDAGFLTINKHTKPIVDASFSPDGTTLATASLDGEVKFFQVYLQDKSPPRCLHQWQPHDGKPVSSLFFLDDHTHPNSEVQYWKFAVTGADHNSEMKVWSCESWNCLQTIRFLPSPNTGPNLGVEPCLKAGMDLSATYLTVSDIRRKVLYILQFHQDKDSSRAHVSSVSEFLLTQPCLSFATLQAQRKKLKKVSEDTNLGDVTTGEVDGDDDEEIPLEANSSDVGVCIKLYSVHVKALQELKIQFKPNSSIPPQPSNSSIGSITQDGLIDPLSDMSMDTLASDIENLPMDKSHVGSDMTQTSDITYASDITHVSERTHLSERSQQSENSRQSEISYQSDHSIQSDRSHQTDRSREGSEPKPVLLTPEAFTSPRKSEPLPNSESVRSSGSSLTQVTGMEDHSVLQSQPSPGSSVTLTPSSSREFSGTGSHMDTPTSVPVPPLQSGEEGLLLSQPSTTGTLDYPATPPASGRPQVSGGFPSALVMTSSPAVPKPIGVTTATEGDQPSVQSSSDTVEEFFSTAASSGRGMRRHVLQSTGSSSSTSLEVSEILEGVRRVSQETTGDENGPEVPAPELGEVIQRDEPVVASTAVPSDPVLAKGVDEEPMRDADRASYSSWPKPPDVSEVNREAQRLATQAIERAAHLHRLSDIGRLEEEDDQPDDDVHIEEEKEIIVDEEDEEEVKEIIHDEVNEEEEEEEMEVEVAELVAISKPSPVTVEVISATVTHPERVETEPAGPGRPDIGAGGESVINSADHAVVKEMQTSLQQMLTILQTQQKEIEQLRSELTQQRESNEAIETLQSQLNQLEAALSSKVAGALSEHHNVQSQHLQQALSNRESQDQRRQDRLVSTVSQTLERTVTQRLDKTIKEEMRRAVIPSVTTLIEPMREQLHVDIAQKLTSTDSLLKENINKMCRSRQVVEAVGQSVASSIQGPIQATCREVVIPAFDRSCQNVFHQMNDTFQKGTQEYLRQLESHLEQVRRRHDDGRDPVVGQLRGMVEAVKHAAEGQKPVVAHLQGMGQNLQDSVDQVKAAQREVEPAVQRALADFREGLLSSVRKIIQDEVNSALRDQQEAINNSVLGVLRSAAVTPSPITASPDPQVTQASILALLRQGELNTAFQQALSASDLGLVMFVCETVNPGQLFNQEPCPLYQPVLLSLIQQLSVDLSQQTELKHKYLEEAVMNLDTSNPVTREHMPTVLGGLCQRLLTYVQAHPTERMTRNLRMLLMATQSLLK